MDVNLHDGKYSWSNPKAIPKDDIRSPVQSSESSVTAASNKDRYKRIPFDGCGSILLHQQPKDFIAPNSPSSENDKTRHRQKGRTGVTLWSASHVISNYIDAKWSKGGSWYNSGDEKGTSLESSRTWTVLELGAGLGLCSAVAAKHGMNVVSTDNDSEVLSLLKENLQRNRIIPNDDDSLETQKQHEVHVHSLDWLRVANDPSAESSHPVFLQLESLGGADLILLSDVIYGATQPAWDALLVLLNEFQSQGRRLGCSGQLRDEEGDDTTMHTNRTPSEDTIVLLGYTQRRRDMSPQDEARFFAMVQAAGMEAVLIPSTSIPHSEKYMLTSLFELRWI